MYDDEGNPETVYTARATDKNYKVGSTQSHKTLSDLAYAEGNNVRALVAVHLDEALAASNPNEEISDENTHGWLDTYGWIQRHVIVETITGGIYDATISIANGRRGLIAYRVGKIRRLGTSLVTSNGKAAGTRMNSKPSKGKVTQNNSDVKLSDRDNVRTDRELLMDTDGEKLTRAERAELEKYRAKVRVSPPWVAAYSRKSALRA